MKNLLAGLIFCLSFLSLNAQPKKLVVAQDGSGNYKSVQAAFDAVPDNNEKPVLIYVKNGIYEEKLHLDSSKHSITLRGQDRYRTILTYNDHTGKVSPTGDTINTFTSESFLLNSNGFVAENISFQNNSGYNAGQAVAMRADADLVIFRNCRFLGNQDVLFPAKPNTRQYFERCYIEGTTDFIFGPSTAWFEHCEIHSKKNSHVTAASTPQETAFGYVFHECALTADTSLHGVSLGRPWRSFSSVVYLNCYLGAHILPEGWNNWKNPSNEKTARYSEYKSCGPGANPSRRFPWTTQLTDEQAGAINFANVFGEWNPLAK
jgi:pectinesterase